ncbi:MAG TPA: serine/threonine-protein kinase [Pirellulales bacterium]|nr:serine/threonine-protein kinase [Pirellulales bacterium]HVC96644.1 serine/threonine-protein kinase [Pirellulales bacterium]
MSVEEQRLGPFLLKERLGAGGMGVVYRATHVESRRPFAVKVLSAKAAGNKRIVARFARELEILKALKHPNIVRCFGGGRQGSDIYLVMELVGGGSIAGLIRRRGRIPWDAAIDYALQVCDGLAYAHEWGIVHRDLKSANLLLTKDGQVKIADFGIARVQYGKKLTAAKHTVGTMAYIAPEQIKGDPPISHRTDLYTLGCVMFEMLTGRLPFLADSMAQLIYQHMEDAPPHVATIALDCPIWLDALVNQLLEKDPLKRPHDATAVARALREAKEKSVSGAGVAQAATGGPSALRVGQEKGEAKEARELLGKKKKRKKKKVPVYERVWFLAACLLLVVAVAAWSLWPLNERQLFERATALMESGDELKWKEARDKYLDALLARYPKGAYESRAKEYIDRIEMAQAEKRLRMHEKRHFQPDGEGERLYAAALDYEQFGDRLTALDKYQSIVKLVPAEGRDRPFVKLAEKRARELMNQSEPADTRLTLIQARLDDADKLEQEGKRMEARKIWSSIVTLYGDNRELEPLVERAQQGLSGEKPAAKARGDAPQASPSPEAGRGT